MDANNPHTFNAGVFSELATYCCPLVRNSLDPIECDFEESIERDFGEFPVDTTESESDKSSSGRSISAFISRGLVEDSGLCTEIAFFSSCPSRGSDLLTQSGKHLRGLVS